MPPELRHAARVLLAILPLAAAHATTLTIATHYTNEQRAPLTACFAEYEQLHPGTTIVHRQLSYRDFLQTVFMARIGGSGPDIYNLATMWTAQLVQGQLLAAPPTEISDFVQKTYLPRTREAMSFQGRVWGIPSEVDVYLLLYNKLLFSGAGISRPPATWEELVQDAARIAKPNRQGQLRVSGFAFGPNPAMVVYPFTALLYSRGQALFSPDRQSANLLTSAATDVLKGQVRLFQTRSTALGASPNQFAGGTVGMMIVPNWYKNQLLQALGEHFTDRVGVAPIPGGRDWRTVQYGFFWGVDSRGTQKVEAWEFLQWLNSPARPGGRSCTGDMLLRLGSLTGNMPDLAASAAELDHPFMRPFADALSSGRALPLDPVPHSIEVEELLRSYVEEAWLGLRSPTQALRKADAAIRSILHESD